MENSITEELKQVNCAHCRLRDIQQINGHLVVATDEVHLGEYNPTSQMGRKVLNVRAQVVVRRHRIIEPVLSSFDCGTMWVDHCGEQRLKPGVRKYACELTLDTNTVNKYLKLSDNNRKVTAVTGEQPYPDHLERFDYWEQLLCRDGLTGRCYWEVKWRGEVLISMSYRGIRRKENSTDCRFGGNNQSWSLRCSDGGHYSVWHNNTRTDLPSSSSSVSNRVGVYVNYPAGTLSFYRVSSDTLIHLHTFNTTFTEPLYPGFWFWSGSSVCLCSL
ncbi:stonustoxin subunit beta-like [Thunnus thynnus]|uniref:stonustoxin subunit beta-like n=1 Tax=Thunnus thynnus TaxID=8237 RepID=UPI003527C514